MSETETRPRNVTLYPRPRHFKNRSRDRLKTETEITSLVYECLFVHVSTGVKLTDRANRMKHDESLSFERMR